MTGSSFRAMAENQRAREISLFEQRHLVYGLTRSRYARRARSGSNALCCDGPLRRANRTFSPFRRRVVATDALQVGAAGDGDHRNHSLSALRAARCLIHEILPTFHVKRGTGTFVPCEGEQIRSRWLAHRTPTALPVRLDHSVIQYGRKRRRFSCWRMSLSANRIHSPEHALGFLK
jgi:hypothetical protein